MQPFIKEGKAKLVHGDGLKAETIRNGWATALEAGNGKVDVVLFTLGAFNPGVFLPPHPYSDF